MLKLTLQYFGHLMWRTDSLENTLMLGKIKGRRRRDDREGGGWMASWIRWTWVWINSGSWWWTGKPGMLESIGSQRVGYDWVTELNWFQGRSCRCLAVWEVRVGMPFLWDFSPRFSLALVCPPSLFVYNGKFSVPTYKIYPFRLPSPKPKNLGFSRRDKANATHLSP